MSRFSASGPEALEINTAVVTPTDRIRWGPILAGVFTALTTLAVLSALGAGIGLGAYDAGDDARRFALGASVWGILSMIIAFFIGGWITARSTAVAGRRNGLLNGTMVATIGIPLILLMLGSAGALLGNEAATRRTMRPSDMAAPGMSGANTANIDDTTEAERRAASRAAWGTFGALVLAIASSALAGYLGARTLDRTEDDRAALPQRERAAAI